jgi:hypothetical protein
LSFRGGQGPNPEPREEQALPFTTTPVITGLEPVIHAMTMRLNCPSTSPAAFCTARALTTMGRFRGQRFCTVMA